MLLDFEAQAKPAYRLTPEVGDGCIRSKQNLVTRLPNPVAQVYLFIVVKKLFIKAAKLSQQATSEHDTTAGHPVDRPFGVSIPPDIHVREEDIGNVR
jgi:hypothetical protein